jgi:peptidoglycan/xylan/chitin deacetylase (PgdA/CDA1 family)
MAAAAVAGAGACAAAAAYVSVAPRCAFWGPVVHRGDPGGQPRFALTFDDGPSPESTPAVLDTLAELGAKATFFVIGRNAQRNPQIVRRMYDQGHVVANHSFDHSHFGAMRRRGYWEQQVRTTDDLIRQIIGLKPALFRPPMGIRTWHVTRAAARNGHTLITWTRRGLDGVRTTPQRIVDRLAMTTRAGDILILHDGIEPNVRRDPSATVAAVGPLIRTLRDRGLEPASIAELTGVRAYEGIKGSHL